MGLYNLIRTSLACPRCAQLAAVEIEVKFGWLRLHESRPGDQVLWSDPLAPRERRLTTSLRGAGIESDETQVFPTADLRPPDGTGAFEGYAVCAECRKDFWVTVRVENDCIGPIVVDPSRSGYIS